MITTMTASASECSRDDDCNGDMDCSDGWCVDRERKDYVYEETPLDEFHAGISLALPIPIGDFAGGDLTQQEWNNNKRDLLKGSSSFIGYGLGVNLYFPVVRDLYLGLKSLVIENRTDVESITLFNGDTSFTKVSSFYNISFLPSIKYMPNLSSSFEMYISAQAGLNIGIAPKYTMGNQTLDSTTNAIITNITEVAFENPVYTFAAGGTIGIRIVEALNIGVSFLYLGEPDFTAKITFGSGSAEHYNSSKPLMVLMVTSGIDF